MPFLEILSLHGNIRNRFNHNFGTQWFRNHWFETYNGTIGSNNKFQLSIQFRRENNYQIF